MRTLTPIKVTAWLDAPLAGDAPCLAALCEFVMASKMRSIMASDKLGDHQVEPRLRGEEVSEPGKIPIPIARRRFGRFPVPLCSSPILPAPLFDGRDFVCKKLATEFAELLAPEGRKVVQTTGGLFKSYRLPLRIRAVERVVWFCECRPQKETGNSPATALRKLLKQAWAIGKKTADGYGRVSRWEVERVEDAPALWADSEQGKVLMRPLPIGDWLPPDLIGARKSFGSPCPPYWMRSLATEIVVPC